MTRSGGMAGVRRAFALLATLLLGGTGGGGVAAAAPPPRPKLIVVISVDQFAASVFERYRPSFTGGLARLAGGISYANGYQSHAATETCPGHSTILTGRHPAATGIVANSWFDVATGSTVYCVSQRGTADPDARGSSLLKVDTLGDWMRRADPAARVVSVSGKDRAAIMLGGHHPNAVYWWVDGRGFGTSSYAGPAGPAVLAPAAVENRAILAGWRRQPPALWSADAPAPCGALAQPHSFGKLAISGTVPPTGARETESGPDFIARTDFADQLRASPMFDRLVLDFAGHLLDADRLGRGPATDLLAISLSATDYVGHRYGNGGAEMCAQVAALDRALGAFLAKLDATHVPYIVALTADHGAEDAPERAGGDTRRLDPAAFGKAINDHLRQALGLDYDPIVADDPQQLVANVPDATTRARVIAETATWLKHRPEVADVFTAAQVQAAAPVSGTSPDRLTIAERFHESYFPGRSGDIAVALKPGTTVGAPRSPGDAVAGHGSPWDYDRRVPILFWWPGIAADPRAEPIETVDIAPTLARLIDLAPPAVDGHCLGAVAPACR